MSEGQSADEVFGLLSDPTRVDVLRAIAVAESELERGEFGGADLAFSEIYERVDVDNSAKLSYHLGELTGTVLRKREGRYSFTRAGEQLVRFVLSGNYERPSDFGPLPVDGTCPFCGGSDLAARLLDRFLGVECGDCERQVAGLPVTAAQVRSADETLLQSVNHAQTAAHEQLRAGVCPECGGSVSTEVVELPESPLPDADPFLAISDCEECLRRTSGPLSYLVAHHPASVAFHWDRGVDVTARPIWAFHEHLREGRWTAERVATDPAEYEVVLGRGDDALRARLDASATVLRTERVRRTPDPES